MVANMRTALCFPRSAGIGTLPLSLLFFIFCLTLCLPQGNKAFACGLVLVDTKPDLGWRRDLCRHVLWGFFWSNFVLAQRQPYVWVWLHTCRYEDWFRAPKRVLVLAPTLKCLIFYFESNLVHVGRQKGLSLWLSDCRYEGWYGAPRKCRHRHPPSGVFFLSLTLCLQQGNQTLDFGLMVADMRTDLCLPRSAGTGTLPLGSLIFYFLSSFVPVAGKVHVGFWLIGCRYEDWSGPPRSAGTCTLPLGCFFLSPTLCLPQGSHPLGFWLNGCRYEDWYVSPE